MYEDVPVAQLDRVSASDAEGRGFESLRVRHFKNPLYCRGFFCDFSLVGFFCRQIIVNGLRYLGGQCGIGTVVKF